MRDAVYDIPQDQYATALRELLRHENDLTNHRIMWLLIGQGFIANAFVTTNGSVSMKLGLQVVGIVLTLSAFVMLYKATRHEATSNIWATKPRRELYQRNTCRSWAGREPGYPVGEGRSGFVHGFDSPMMSSNRGRSCRFCSSSCG